MNRSWKKSWYTVLTFVRINTRRFFRDRLALFFSIAFPIGLLVVFGFIYGHDNKVSFNVAVINQSQSQFASQFIKSSSDSGVLKIDDTTKTLDAAKEKMSRNTLDATIILPKDFGDVQNGQQYPSGQAQVVYTVNNQQSATTLISILNAQFKAINDKLVPSVTPFTVTGQQLSQKSLSAFDYAFAGILGFSLIGMGIFGPLNVFPELKKMGILRRLRTTPLKVWQYFVATMIGQAIIGLISFGLMFAIAIFFFHLDIAGNWAELVIFLILSIVTMLGIGLALGGWAKNERQAAPLSNLIVFPMMFLSGTFFPRYLMPEWLQHVSAFLPLTPMIDGIRLIATEGKHFIDILPQIGLVGAWLVVIYLIAFRVFKWE
jgi:ABC-2 type transport system permease protein